MKKEELIKNYPDLLKEIFVEFTNESFKKAITWKEYVENNKSKKVLFVTKDNVEIFEGDIFWVFYPNVSYCDFIAKTSTKELYQPNSGKILFSTKEALLKYRLKHAKVLSYDDIVDSLDSDYSRHDLLDKIKERLNGNT